MTNKHIFKIEEGNLFALVSVNGNDYISFSGAPSETGYSTVLGVDVPFTDIEDCIATEPSYVLTEHQPTIDGDGAPYFKVIGYALAPQHEFDNTRPPRKPRPSDYQ